MSCCDYSTLGDMNQQKKGMIPIPRTTVIGVQIVPDFKAPTYDTLTHGVKAPGCSGFFNIMSAYGKNAAMCDQQYSSRPCPCRGM